MKQKILLNAVVIIFLLTTIIAQELKIVKIHDTNLFELEDSSFISLAGINTPSRNDSNLIFNNIIVSTYNYYYTNLDKRNLEIEIVDTISTKPKIYSVILKKLFAFETIDINEVFLRNGLGYYESDSIIQDEKYIKAQRAAIENKKGIWRYYKNDAHQIPNQINYSDTNLFLAGTDFSPISIEQDNIRNEITFGNIILQVVVSQGTGLVGAFFCGITAGALSFQRGLAAAGWAGLGAIAGYYFGESLGIYWTAKSWNDNISLPLTAAFTFGGVGLAILLGITTNWAEGSWIPFLAFPLVSGMLYANVFSVEGNTTNVTSFKTNDFNVGITHSDFYNQQRLFNFELFRLNF